MVRVVKVKKRICCILLSVLMVIMPLCAAMVPRMQVKAAGVLGAEQTIEMLQILYSALASGMMVSGATQADYSDADTAIELMDEFMDSMASAVGIPTGELPSWMQGTTFTLSDGTVYTLTDVNDYLNTLDEPIEEEGLATGTWGKLGVKKADLEENLRSQFKVVEGGGGTDPEQDPYPNISGFKIATGFFGMMADFIGDLFNGATDVPAKDYFNDNYYDGRYSPNDTKYYISLERYYPQWNESSVINASGEGYGYGLIRTSDTTSQTYNISYYNTTNAVLKTYVSFPVSVYNYASDGTMTESSGYITSVNRGENYVLSTNLPQFETQAAMLSFYQDNDASGVTNKAPLDISSLIGNGIIGSFSIFEGKQVKPQTFSDTYKAIDSAYDNQIAPQISDDPVLNTDLFNQIMASTAANVASNSEIIPDTDPVTDPVKVPGQLPSDIPITIPSDQPINIPQSEEDLRQDNAAEAETALDEAMNGSNYKYDLSDVFPFCIPFDFVDLLKALSAEPKTPSFEFPFVVPILGINNVYVIDLNWMNTVMQIVRTMEIVGFLMFLMVLTGKVIKW